MNERKEFEKWLKKFDKVIVKAADPLIHTLPDRSWLPHIDETLRTNSGGRKVNNNLVRMLVYTRNEVRDKTIKSMLEEWTKDPLGPNAIRIEILCNYLTTFKKKGYCNVLKRILETYGTKEWLVDMTPVHMAYVLHAVNKLKCVGCYGKVKEIVGFGTRMNPWVMLEGKEALKTLEKMKK